MLDENEEMQELITKAMAEGFAATMKEVASMEFRKVGILPKREQEEQSRGRTRHDRTQEVMDKGRTARQRS